MNFYSLTFEELTDWLSKRDLNKALASKLYNWHFKKANLSVFDHQDMPQRGFEELKALSFKLPQLQKYYVSKDTTVKFLFKLEDGKTIETVLIPFQDKYSLCLSSQVGCAMKCSFCFTGTQGFSRHLKTHEIVGQYLGVRKWLKENRPLEENRILNLVYMGQGEPLNNIKAVSKSSKIFISQHGASFAPHKITVSTAGFLPGLKKWNELMPSVNLALSLHSTQKVKRDELIPMNKRFDLKDVLSEIDQIPLKKDRFVTYEYLLIKNFNDNKEDARGLGELLKGKKAYINLIPFNPIPGSSYERPSAQKVEEFKAWLEPFNVPTTIRKTKGDEILAACGQLKTH
jgi:23S rRNA (adenine2503-C2)-methyltransferase